MLCILKLNWCQKQELAQWEIPFDKVAFALCVACRLQYEHE